jgi:hypothetical protein
MAVSRLHAIWPEINVDHVHDDLLRLAELAADNPFQGRAVGLIKIPDVFHNGFHTIILPRPTPLGDGIRAAANRSGCSIGTRLRQLSM